MTVEIGDLLHEFDHAARLFGRNRYINDVLALIFQDMLDFYLISLKFFSRKRWQSFFDAVWPRKKEEIDHVVERIRENTSKLRHEVRLEDIEEAYNSRQADIEQHAKQEESNRRQEFEAMESRLAQVNYGKKLNILCGRFCKGTGEWLLQHEDTTKWLDMSVDSRDILWLVGIPGAGKTYLAACLVQASMLNSGHTLFAFISHDRKDDCALSIIHSFVFQLARKSPTLQDLVRFTNRDLLESDLMTAVKLLIDLINDSDSVRIVLDGLDEMDEHERARLARQLCKVSRDCENVRILIASRQESELQTILGKGPKSLRVDSHNSDSIHGFVSSRFDSWLSTRRFLPEEVKEIQGLTAGIAGNAKGMFLYANLILKSLDYLHSVEEIRRDLKVLPTDLDAAYERIFTRINESLGDSVAREKARRILGWIGCSPVPLSIRELEQALVIDVGNLGQVPVGISDLPVVSLCGPVVESIDDELHFVHFTAKEYFFSPSIKAFLDPTQHTLDLALCCITYLCQDHHDSTATVNPDLFREHAINGVYRLHHFASSNWLKLVEQYLRSKPHQTDAKNFERLVELLESLLERRQNSAFQPPETATTYPVLEPLKNTVGIEVVELVRNEKEFQRNADTRLYELGKGEWNASDPLTLRDTTAALHHFLDSFVCPPGHHNERCHCNSCSTLFHYGKKVFKCRFVGCPDQRLGFETKSERQQHSKTHDRPWTCEVNGCEYSTAGFISRQMRDHHLDQAHRGGPTSTQPIVNSPSTMTALLKQLVRTGNYSVSPWAEAQYDSLPPNLELEVLAEAARYGTVDVMKSLRDKPERLVLVAKFPQPMPWDVVAQAALEGMNREVLQWLRTETERKLPTIESYHLMPRDIEGVHPLVSQLVNSEEPDLLYHEYLEQVFLGILLVTATQRRQKTITKYVRVWLGDTRTEYFLISAWRAANREMKVFGNTWSRLLAAVANTSCSVNAGTVLIELGANVNFRGKLGTLTPPLLNVARKDTQESAEFIRLLLNHGAIYPAHVSEMKGPLGIKKWLGITWDELVMESKNAQEKRKADDQNIPVKDR